MNVSGEAGTGMQEDQMVMFGMFPNGFVRGACCRMATILQADISLDVGWEVGGGEVLRTAVGCVS